LNLRDPQQVVFPWLEIFTHLIGILLNALLRFHSDFSTFILYIWTPVVLSEVISVLYYIFVSCFQYLHATDFLVLVGNLNKLITLN